MINCWHGTNGPKLKCSRFVYFQLWDLMSSHVNEGSMETCTCYFPLSYGSWKYIVCQLMQDHKGPCRGPPPKCATTNYFKCTTTFCHYPTCHLLWNYLINSRNLLGLATCNFYYLFHHVNFESSHILYATNYFSKLPYIN